MQPHLSLRLFPLNFVLRNTIQSISPLMTTFIAITLTSSAANAKTNTTAPSFIYIVIFKEIAINNDKKVEK